MSAVLEKQVLLRTVAHGNVPLRTFSGIHSCTRSARGVRALCAARGGEARARASRGSAQASEYSATCPIAVALSRSHCSAPLPLTHAMLACAPMPPCHHCSMPPCHHCSMPPCPIARCLHAPCPMHAPALQRSAQWRLRVVGSVQLHRTCGRRARATSSVTSKTRRRSWRRSRSAPDSIRADKSALLDTTGV
jgi:hypothetical protein